MSDETTAMQPLPAVVALQQELWAMEDRAEEAGDKTSLLELQSLHANLVSFANGIGIVVQNRIGGAK